MYTCDLDNSFRQGWGQDKLPRIFRLSYTAGEDSALWWEKKEHNYLSLSYLNLEKDWPKIVTGAVTEKTN